jgi:hypothetical protein
MSVLLPDWATMPEPIKKELRLRIEAIRQELNGIDNLGEAHPQSAFRMGTIIKNAQEFVAIIQRVEGANNADFYAYECYRKEQSND